MKSRNKDDAICLGDPSLQILKIRSKILASFYFVFCGKCHKHPEEVTSTENRSFMDRNITKLTVQVI